MKSDLEETAMLTGLFNIAAATVKMIIERMPAENAELMHQRLVAGDRIKISIAVSPPRRITMTLINDTSGTLFYHASPDSDDDPEMAMH